MYDKPKLPVKTADTPEHNWHTADPTAPAYVSRFYHDGTYHPSCGPVNGERQFLNTPPNAFFRHPDDDDETTPVVVIPSELGEIPTEIVENNGQASSTLYDDMPDSNSSGTAAKSQFSSIPESFDQMHAKESVPTTQPRPAISTGDRPRSSVKRLSSSLSLLNLNRKNPQNANSTGNLSSETKLHRSTSSLFRRSFLFRGNSSSSFPDRASETFSTEKTATDTDWRRKLKAFRPSSHLSGNTTETPKPSTTTASSASSKAIPGVQESSSETSGPSVTPLVDTPRWRSLSYTPSLTHSSSSSSLSSSTTRTSLFKRYRRTNTSLGEGIGGRVMTVIRKSDNQVFAVKIFRKKDLFESDREYTKKVSGEYTIGSTLKHPNIISTIEISYEGDLVYQVMEYAEFDMFQLVMSHKMSIGEIYCCFCQLLLGLQYLHHMGVAHRDLKLDNCVVTRDGVVKIIDFGAAVVFSYPFSKTIVPALGIAGSDPYLSPEVCTELKYDPRPADIWSAAIVFFCMLRRKFPWKKPVLSDPSFAKFVQRDGETLSEAMKRSRNTEITGPKADGLYSDGISKLEDISHNREYYHSSTADVQRLPLPTKNDFGEMRVLNSCPPETRNLFSEMLQIAPCDRIDIDGCINSEFVRTIDVCRCYSDSCGNVRVSPAANHQHTKLDSSQAHISSYFEAKEKQKRKQKK